MNVVATNCPVGFTGKYCGKQCFYPHYGIGCQQTCVCSKRLCNVSTGCQFIKTGIWIIKNKITILKTQTSLNAYICSSYINHLYWLFVCVRRVVVYLLKFRKKIILMTVTNCWIYLVSILWLYMLSALCLFNKDVLPVI